MTLAGHRGSSYTAPENTLAANRLAFEQGADGVEFDVLKSADGEIFLIHDYTLKKTGSPICPPELCTLGGMTQAQYSDKLSQNVAGLSYYDFIQYVDVGSWKGVEYADQRPPTLDQAMAEIPNGKYVLCEVKGSDSELGRAVADEAARWPANTFQIIGFSFDVMTEVKARLVGFGRSNPVWYLKNARSESAAKSAISSARSRGLDGVDLKAYSGVVTKSVADYAHQQALGLGVWVSKSNATCMDTPSNAGLMDNRGIDFFTTDFPPNVAKWMPKRHLPVKCRVGDRIVGQWAGNSKWYSGTITDVHSATSCDILADDDNADLGWQNVGLSRVLKSSDHGGDLEWCWGAADVGSIPGTYEVRFCNEFTVPQPTVTCGQGDRIVGQWGGNGLWYSGVIQRVHSAKSSSIFSDDDNDGADWRNVGLSRVLKSSDDGSQLQWCWRACDAYSTPDTFDVHACTEFAFTPSRCGEGDRIVGQWGGNDKWYSGVIKKVHSTTSCDILADDENDGSDWQNVGPSRVLKSSDTGSQQKWSWGAEDVYSIPYTFDVTPCSQFFQA